MHRGNTTKKPHQRWQTVILPHDAVSICRVTSFHISYTQKAYPFPPFSLLPRPLPRFSRRLGPPFVHTPTKGTKFLHAALSIFWPSPDAPQPQRSQAQWARIIDPYDKESLPSWHVQLPEQGEVVAALTPLHQVTKDRLKQVPSSTF